ncbi:integrin alpha-PS2 isoform X2 [Planococcus citri]|uniref:integrin alpha-PS2 isoform X2 n=1 Tax=Planococcus citri TaxID=170843 RepID=UPI0031F90707
MSRKSCSDGAFGWRTFRVICSILVIFVVNFIEAFNVDLPSAVLYHGTSQSMFGFTVAEYKEDGRSWVLIGAPEAPDSHFSLEEADYRGGSVYACDVRENDRCSSLRFPLGGRTGNLKPDYKGRQWLGATLTTAGPNGAVLACAPRYYWFTPNKNSSAFREPVGSCYYSEKGFSNFTEYSPCRINTRSSFGYGKLGSCQAGFSATISKDSNRFYLGAVGSYYWQGRLIARNFRGRPEFMSTEEGPKHTDDSYMGYAVTSLDFYGTVISGAAVGVPRADRLLGKVRIFTWNMINFKNLTGEQFAAYFGYSICTADVDGDGAEDLIVGAPMYSTFQSNDYETGRVYVYYQGNELCASLNSTCGDSKFSRWNFINGEHTKGRFGLAVASVGDINQDGFGDFAVSAPYEGSFSECRDQRTKASNTGAVYIFHGSRYGIRSKYSQVIRASDVYQQNQVSSYLNTFGYSLSGGSDLDDNLYPDLVVGAYESDVVYLFRSRPVIQLVANFSFATTKKAIGLDEFTCQLRGNIWVPCVTLQMCLVYDGIGVESQIELWVRITLDSRNPKASRMFFLEKDEAYSATNKEPDRIFQNRLRLYKGTTLCRNMTTYVARLSANQDKLTPLEAELKYELVELGPRRPNVLPSILNMDDETPLTRKDFLSIKNNCGDDNVCIPDLHMSINSNVDQYVLGSGHLYFNVSVINDGEDSFGSTFKLRIPQGVNYSRSELISSTSSDIAIYCSVPNFMNNNTITCDIGNPLPRRKMVNFSVILEPNNEVEESRFEFWANVNSTNSELSKTMADNEKSFYIQIVEKTSLTIESSCTPKEVYYNISQYNFEDIQSDIQAGPFLKHEYVIKNSGPSEITEATAVFYWPLKIASGEDLLYLITEPETRGPIVCDKIVNPNYRQLELRRKFRDDDTSSSQESWQTGTSWQNSGSTHSQETYYTQGTKVTQSGSINDIPRPYGTGNKGPEYTKNDGTFQTGSIGLNNNQGGNSYQQSGQNTYTYQQTGQTGVYQGGQVYQGGSSQNNQGGYYGNVQTNQGGYVQTGQGGYTNVNQGSQGVYTGTGQAGQAGQGIYTGGGSQGSYSGSQNTYSQSGSQNTYTSQSGQSYSGGAQGGYYGTYQGQGGSSVNYGSGGGGGYQVQGSGTGNRQNLNSVHESVTNYTKSTNFDGNNPNTYTETKWWTNDNGVVRNGSYSNVNNGLAYDTNIPLNTDKKTFFSDKQGGGATYYNQGGSSSSSSSSSSGGSIDLNTLKGANIHKVYDPATGTYITTIEEKITSLDPDVKKRLEETGSIYHVKSENTQIVNPHKVTYGPVTFTGDISPSRMSTRSNKSPDSILINDDGDDDDDDNKDEDEDEDEDDSSKPLHRRKRQVFGGYVDNSFCASAQCIRVQCVIRRLKAEQEATVTFPSIVWVKTIQKIALFRPVQVGSYVEVNITKLPHIRAQVSNVTYVSEVLTNVTSLDYGKTPPDVIPLWVVVGSACLGALILMLLVYLLYKSGFFKRNRPPMMPERQPLNRNGQYHLGDEAL